MSLSEEERSILVKLEYEKAQSVFAQISPSPHNYTL